MQILRGEVWVIEFDPTKGDEIEKTRPGVIINSDGMGDYDLNIVVPVTSWKPLYRNKPWMVELPRNPINGLDENSAADSFQVKSLSTKRIQKKIGEVRQNKLEEIVTAVSLCIDYTP